MNTTELYKITVIGGGSFGTAIADICAHNRHPVTVWVRNPEQAQSINQKHMNERYLPGFSVDANIRATTHMEQATQDADIIFIAIPSQSFRSVVRRLNPPTHSRLISTTKGIESGSFALMSQILREEHPQASIGVLSGPNLAREIMKKAPTATVIASEDDALCTLIQSVLRSRYFRVYANHDTYGVELAGALKNIYAILVGMAAGLGLGENTKSMLITRGLAEMSRFAVQLGANPLTFLGLAGVGDLIVTCASDLSRNYRLGYWIAKGDNLEQAINRLGQTAEGANTLKQVHEKTCELNIHMPLMHALYGVLYEGIQVSALTKRIMLGEQTCDVEFSLASPESRYGS